MSLLLNHFFHQEPILKPFSQSKIPKIQDIQNISLVLGLESIELSHFHPESLIQAKIIEPTFAVKKVSIQPQCVQLDFEQNITLIGLPKSFILRESMHNINLDSLKSLKIIQNYINHFQQAKYQSFTLNFQQIFNLPNQQTFLSNYVKNTLLSSFTHQAMQPALSQINLQWKYQLEHCPLSLLIKVGNLTKFSAHHPPFLSFVGSFAYKIASFHPQERQRKLTNALNNIPQDYRLFRHLVDNQFLG